MSTFWLQFQCFEFRVLVTIDDGIYYFESCVIYVLIVVDACVFLLLCVLLQCPLRSAGGTHPGQERFDEIFFVRNFLLKRR